MKPRRRQWRRTILGSIVSYAKKSATRISTGGNSVRKSLKIVVEKEKLKNLKECSDSCSIIFHPEGRFLLDPISLPIRLFLRLINFVNA
ncbi:hypothetical protein HID58_034124 [Brassica napus]|uniref:Uncharacterized protein n=1 Tax=Brassica napus TaxID=3708 RepID=A0ABQ8C1E8_BRANA|nr:hypothetical protein HID58_034124 [Brassica napus]